MKLRFASESDLNEIYAMICELAEFEKAANEVTINLDDLKRDGFGINPLFEVILAEESNKILGMAFYYFSYSTWKGKCIYLEDIIVKSAYRGKGIGKQLFLEVMKRAKDTNARRMQWQVLDWNSDAIEFYKNLGASIDGSWLNGRLTKKEIDIILNKH